MLERGEMMGFQEAHQAWLDRHTARRSGERKSRLERGHGHGERLFLEQVWWPLFGHFDHLHPEYEVLDWRGQPYFVDFAWIVGNVRFVFEVKGYGPHVQQMDRVRYCRELNRETFLQTLGYRVVSIPYDDLEQRPEIIRYLLKTLLLPFANMGIDPDHSLAEREILFLVQKKNGQIRPVDLVRELDVNWRTAVKLLQRLCDKGKLRPVAAGRSGRITRYERVVEGADVVWM
jgi:hypothetical protein